jgi:hypothetical protein
MQSFGWHDPMTTMNEMELVLKKIADFEALWRTSERLTQRCSESSSVSVSPQTFTELAARIKQGDLEKDALEKLPGGRRLLDETSALHDVSGNPLFGFMRDGEQSLDRSDIEPPATRLSLARDVPFKRSVAMR